MSEASNDIRVMVQRAQDAWNAAFNRGDAVGVAAQYTQNAAVLPPTHSVIKGTAAIRDFWQGLITAGFKEHGIEMLDAEAEGGFAFASGRWWASGPGEGGKAQRFEGIVVTVMRRQGDGTWKACLHTWN